MKHWLLLAPLALVTLTPPAIAQWGSAPPVLHEPIPPDPREDVALAISLDGDLPAAIDTSRGLVAAPDPARPLEAGDSPYRNGPSDALGSSFHPDRDTRRPDVLPYDDPFSPSTAPFKRLSAFDAVDAFYTLSVRNPRTTPLPIAAYPTPDPTEEHFYADLVVDLVAAQKVRIPSVGPGARVLRARAGIGTQDVRFSLSKDGAENWFIEAEATTRARVVMELSVPRAAFGGDFGNPSWAELMPVSPPLPPPVQRSAAEVASKIGLTRRLSPRDNLTKLVSYFRGFTESEDPPASSRDIYLDLALSRKGVCRHRAFAFMVTAMWLGLPTRMVVNEAHAWVEVHDGRLWRRIDLGGAGRTLHDPLSANVPYEPPADPFSWPPGAARGDDLADRARRAGTSPNAAPADATGGASAGASSSAPPPGSVASNGTQAADPGTSASGGSSTPSGAATATSGNGGASGDRARPQGGGASPFGGGPDARAGTADAPTDDRAPSTVTMSVLGSDAHRGAPLRVRGAVASEGEPCKHVSVEILLRSRAHGEVSIGQLATDERGAFDGAIVLPSAVPLGDYDARARTLGDGRCGLGSSK